MSKFLQSVSHWLGIGWLAHQGLTVIVAVLILAALTCGILARFGVPMPPGPQNLMKGSDH